MAKKDTFYFSHDYGARNDPKLIKLRIKLGNAGLGLYWSLIEILYEQGGKLLLSDIDVLADDLRSDEPTLNTLIKGFELFAFDEDHFWSESANRRLNIRNEKSLKAKESVAKRWSKRDNLNSSNVDTNVSTQQYERIKDGLQSHFDIDTSVSDSGTIYESKGNHINEIKKKEMSKGDNITPTLTDVLLFFKNELGLDGNDGERFFNKYEGLGWMDGKTPIINWKAIAKNWLTTSLKKEKGSAEKEKNDWYLSQIHRFEQLFPKKSAESLRKILEILCDKCIKAGDTTVEVDLKEGAIAANTTELKFTNAIKTMASFEILKISGPKYSDKWTVTVTSAI